MCVEIDSNLNSISCSNRIRNIVFANATHSIRIRRDVGYLVEDSLITPVPWELSFTLFACTRSVSIQYMIPTMLSEINELINL